MLHVWRKCCQQICLSRLKYTTIYISDTDIPLIKPHSEEDSDEPESSSGLFSVPAHKPTPSNPLLFELDSTTPEQHSTRSGCLIEEISSSSDILGSQKPAPLIKEVSSNQGAPSGQRSQSSTQTGFKPIIEVVSSNQGPPSGQTSESPDQTGFKPLIEVVSSEGMEQSGSSQERWASRVVREKVSEASSQPLLIEEIEDLDTGACVCVFACMCVCMCVNPCIHATLRGR